MRVFPCKKNLISCFAGEEAGVEDRTEESEEVGEDFGEALMGETGVGSGAGGTFEDHSGVEEKGEGEEEVEEDHTETDLRTEEVKGTHHREDLVIEKIGLIIIDVLHPRLNLATLHIGRAEKAGLGMVSQLQSLPTPAPGSRMDRESHQGILMAPGDL